MKITSNITKEVHKPAVKYVEEEWSRKYNGDISILLGETHIYLNADEARDFANDLNAAYWQVIGRIAAEQDAGRLALKAQREAEAAALKAAEDAE